MESKPTRVNLADFPLINKLLLAFLARLNGEKIAVPEYKLMGFGLGLPRRLRASVVNKKVEKMS